MTEKVTRFRKAEYRGANSAGDAPRWHIAAYPYLKGEVYREYAALCGYTIESPWLKNVLLSKASGKPAGQHCSKCIQKNVREG